MPEMRFAPVMGIGGDGLVSAVALLRPGFGRTPKFDHDTSSPAFLRIARVF